MITKSYIEKNLKQIESLYSKSNTISKSLFYSKLAIIELCGWIEISMDDIISKYGHKYIKTQKNLKFLNEMVIEKNYGFGYDKYFRNMLIKTIGLVGVEYLENKLDPAYFDPLKAELSNLNKTRNTEAHNYIKGITRTIDAPSITKQRFNTIYLGLKNIEFVLKNLKIYKKS